MSDAEAEELEEPVSGSTPDDASEPIPESVPDDWLDQKPFDPAGR
jgi:hypothetical protein